MDVLILVNITRLYPKNKAKVYQNSTRGNFFESACCCLDKTISLGKVGQKLLFGGKAEYEDLYLDSVFCVFQSL